MQIMKALRRILPLFVFSEYRAKGITFAHRISSLLFGSPNWRRGNGIIGTAFEFDLLFRDAVGTVSSALGLGEMSIPPRTAPVFSIDRRGNMFAEGLPRVWLSEVAGNTSLDSGRRVFTECYPCGRDEGGMRAFELAERYIGEGMSMSGCDCEGALECMKCAEILLIHSVRRGNREAARNLRWLYENMLSEEDAWTFALEKKARHSLHNVCGECLGKVSELMDVETESSGCAA